MKFLFVVILALLISCSDTGTKPIDGNNVVPAGTLRPANTVTKDGKVYTLKFVDNFEGTMTDVRKEWFTDTDGNIGTETGGRPSPFPKRPYWQDEALAVKDGVLEMYTMVDPLGREHYITRAAANVGSTNTEDKTKYITGGIHRKASSTEGVANTYGYYEARIKMRKASAFHWDAFWSYEVANASSFANQLEYEFDIMEYVGVENIMDQTTHWWRKSTAPAGLAGGRMIPSKTFRPGVPGVSAGTQLTEWFTLGLLWTEEKVIYYMNGEISVWLDKNGNAFNKDGSQATHHTLTDPEKNILAANDMPIITPYFQNFKFTTELGNNYNGSKRSQFEAQLDADFAREGVDRDIMFVDYFVHYE